MGDFREHGVLMYLDKELYTAFIRLQADRKLGRSYAGLLLLTEGLHKIGYLSEDSYRTHVNKYSKGLIEESTGSKPRTKEELLEHKKAADLERMFSKVLRQWSTMNEKSRVSWLQKAKENPTVPNAQLVLALANEEGPLQGEKSP